MVCVWDHISAKAGIPEVGIIGRRGGGGKWRLVLLGEDREEVIRQNNQTEVYQKSSQTLVFLLRFLVVT
jgi:hypothetical protein